MSRWRQALHPYLLLLPVALAAAVLAGALAQPLDLWLTYQRFPALAQDDAAPDQALLVTLDEPDRQQILASGALSRVCPGAEAAHYFEGRGYLQWRALHACLIDRLAAAGARVVALDFFFTEEAPEATATLSAALAAARRSGVQVVLGWHFAQAAKVSLHALATPGLLEVHEDALFDTVRHYPLCDEDRSAPGSCHAALALQAFSLLHGEPARCARSSSGCAPLWPKEVLGRSLIGVRPSRDAARISYADALLHPDALARALGPRRTVFVGLTGDWARRGADVHRLAFDAPEPLRNDSLDRREVPGLFVHALAFHELAGPSLLFQPSEAQEWLLWVAAFLCGGVPSMVLGLWLAPREGLFAAPRPDQRRLPRLRLWPGPLLLGPALCGAVLAAAFRVPALCPAASALAIACAAAAVWSLPALRAFRAGSRFVEAVLALDEAARARGWPPLVRLPRAGPGELLRQVGAPALSPEAIFWLVQVVTGSAVEAEAAKTFQQRLPRRFFAEHGWLAPGASQESLDAPLQRADELSEALVCTAARRIRNLKSHAELPAHATGLAQRALEGLGARGGVLSAAASAEVQSRLLAAFTSYLRAAAVFVQSHPPAK